MGGQDRTAEQIIASIAGRAHGLVTRGELLAAGLSARQIDRRLSRGLLVLVHPGVYSVGHPPTSMEARYLAAVKACGDAALLSGMAAAFLLGLVKGREPAPEVTAPTERRVAGIRTTRRRGLEPERDGMLHRRIPVTTVAHTLVDLAPRLGDGELARACHEASVRHRVRAAEVAAEAARRPNAPGAARLRRVLRGDTRVTLSRLERAFLALLRTDGLPLPETNRPAGGRYADCRWPDLKVTVELDGYAFHATRHAWELDRRREREAYARGDQFRRYTYGDVIERPLETLAELRVLLCGACASPR